MTPEQLDEHARKFLAKLFAETKGRRNAFCEDEEIGAAVGLDADATLVVTSYLEGCGLVEQFTMAGHVGITAAGISALQSPAPDPGTKVNILHVGQMHGSQIQQGTSHSQQTQINKTVSQDELKRLVGDLVAQFAAVKIPSEQKEDFEATIQTLEVQSRVSKPKAEVVRPLLNHLVEFAVIFGADLASATLTAFMHAHGWIP